tara:strand:- start:594 stop:731 length:138 start_codon:yes stop_codon:yes gene_type:complete
MGLLFIIVMAKENKGIFLWQCNGCKIVLSETSKKQFKEIINKHTC